VLRSTDLLVVDWTIYFSKWPNDDMHWGYN
jgi:hypothetical protein